MQEVEVFAAGFGDDDYVFGADAAEGFVVEIGLDGEGVAEDEFGAFEIGERRFMDVQADAVAGVDWPGRFSPRVR